MGSLAVRKCPPSAGTVPAVPAPGTPELWVSSRTMSVESLGGHTVALVSTTWFPDVAALFPEMGGPSMEWSYNVETRDEGLVLTRAATPAPGDAPSWDPAQPAMTAPPQPAMTGPAATAPPTTAT